jgi:hypothetical protein
MQLRKHISDSRKKTRSKLPFIRQILQILSIFLKLAPPLTTSCIPLGGRVPPGWEPLHKNMALAFNGQALVKRFAINHLYIVQVTMY